MKTCHDCRLSLPLSEFNKNRTRYDGVQSCCRTCQAIRCRDWHQRNPEKGAKATAEWISRNRDKTRVHRILRSAIERGELVRPQQCEKCRSAGRIHAHHENYDHPLDVQWLCVRCHGALRTNPYALEAVEEDLTSLLPPGYEARIREWSSDE